ANINTTRNLQYSNNHNTSNSFLIFYVQIYYSNNAIMTTENKQYFFENDSEASIAHREAFCKEPDLSEQSLSNDERIWLDVNNSRNTTETPVDAPSLPWFLPDEIEVQKWFCHHKPDTVLLIYNSDIRQSLYHVIKATSHHTETEGDKDGFFAFAVEDQYPRRMPAEMILLWKVTSEVFNRWAEAPFKNREGRALEIRVAVLRQSFRTLVKELMKTWDDAHAGNRIFDKLIANAPGGIPLEGEGVAGFLIKIWIDCCEKLLAHAE
ncbi:hypothetical protein IQ07DRAFT_35351, partial [Pyrenochaeta sp. DS3sAY3a]